MNGGMWGRARGRVCVCTQCASVCESVRGVDVYVDVIKVTCGQKKRKRKVS